MDDVVVAIMASKTCRFCRASGPSQCPPSDDLDRERGALVVSALWLSDAVLIVVDPSPTGVGIRSTEDLETWLPQGDPIY